MAAILLLVAIAVVLFSDSSPFGLGARAYAETEFSRASSTSARGTIQLAQLQDQFESVAIKAAPSVVAISASLTNIDSDDALRTEALNGDKLEAMLNRTTRTVGTGFFIDAEGYILTNEHVVAEAGQMWVTTDDRKVYPAIVVGSDPRSDLAVLKIPARSTPAVQFAPLNTIQRGMWTIALGNPYGLAELGEMSMSVGIVSAIDRSLPKLSSKENRLYSNLIQTTAEINPGNSGGPLFDLSGRVIGINTAVILPQKQTNGIGFAIPVTERLMKKIEDLKRGREVVYGYVGLMVSNPTQRDRRSAGVKEDAGVVVDSVEEASPAHGNLKIGDLILEIDGQTVRDSDHFVRAIGELPVGERRAMVLRREGKPVTVEIATRRRQVPSLAVTLEKQRLRWRGMLLGPLPANWNVEGKRPDQGVLVLGVDQNSPAVQNGIEAGAVITAIGGRTVADMIELQRVINDVPPEQWTIQTYGTPNGAMMAVGQ